MKRSVLLVCVLALTACLGLGSPDTPLIQAVSALPSDSVFIIHMIPSVLASVSPASMTPEAKKLADKIEWVAISAQEPSETTVGALVLIKAPSITLEEVLTFGTGTVAQGSSIGIENAELVTYNGVQIYLMYGPVEAIASSRDIYVMGNRDLVEGVLDVIGGRKPSFYSENMDFVNAIEEESMTMVLNDISAGGGSRGTGSVLSGLDMTAIGANKMYVTIDGSDLMMTMGINFIDEKKAEGFAMLMQMAKAMASAENPELAKLEVEEQGRIVKVTMPLPSNISETPFGTGTFT